MEAGGLDARFFAHMEEIDLCWRLRARGRGLVCVPQSVVYHVGAATLKKESPRKTFLNFRNNLLMLYKNLPDAELKPVMRMRALLDYVAALHYVLLLQFANAWAVVRARRSYRAMKPALSADRAENKRMALSTAIPERKGFSLLWQYYVHGKKTFGAL